jgi:hypothetical protein
MNIRLAFILALLMSTAVAGPPQGAIHFSGKVEDERIRIVELIQGCYDLDRLIDRVGLPDSVLEQTYYGVRHPDERCATGDLRFHLRRVRFASVSDLIDLDVVVNSVGKIRFVLITEKVRSKGATRLRRFPCA